MKFFVYLISFILILALMGLFVIKRPGGQAWLTFDDVIPKKLMIDKEIEFIADKFLASFENFTTKEDSQVEQGSEVKIYRWKDTNGNWSYSDKPRSSADSEEVFLDPNDVVVLPAFKASSSDLSTSKSSIQDNKLPPSHSNTTPSKILDLYKDANNVQKLMDERQQNISNEIENSTR